jgi:hypothetical protein
MVLVLFAGRTLAQTATTPTPSPPMPASAISVLTPDEFTPIMRVVTVPEYKVTNMVTTKFGNPTDPEYFVVIRFQSSHPSAPSKGGAKAAYAANGNQNGASAPAAKLQTADLKPVMSGFDTGVALGDTKNCAIKLQYPLGIAAPSAIDLGERAPAAGYDEHSVLSSRQ